LFQTQIAASVVISDLQSIKSLKIRPNARQPLQNPRQASPWIWTDMEFKLRWEGGVPIPLIGFGRITPGKVVTDPVS
jgi:hypothetical protein